MTIDYGQAYVEMGYTAVDCKGVDLTSAVRVTSNVDIWKAGLYTVTYNVTDSAGLTARATRTVNVKAKPPEPTPVTKPPTLTVNGSNPIVLHQTSNTPYTEQSARAIDSDGTNISHLVAYSTPVIRNIAGTYTVTYSVASPVTGLTATATRRVQIISPTERREPRATYGLEGQAKQGAVITHTGIVANAVGFVDLRVRSIQNNTTITAKLVDTATKKAVLTDTFTATGVKQYKINQGKYELVVSMDKANGNSKYTIELTMPEVAPTMVFAQNEIPFAGQMMIVGSNPIILHLGGSQYIEQGAVAYTQFGENITSKILTRGKPDTSKAGIYYVDYIVSDGLGNRMKMTREVRVLAPDEAGIFADDEVPLGAAGPETFIYTVGKDETLFSIAESVYGDSSRWNEILILNKDAGGRNMRFLSEGTELIMYVD